MTAYNFDPEFASPAEWARMYRAQGLQVVPARYPMVVPGDKRPALSTWTEFHNDMVSDAIFDGWFPAGCHPNMGVITGAASGGLLVVDLDLYKGAQVAEWWTSVTNDVEPETWVQMTGGGGRQYFFRVPVDLGITIASTPIADIRCQGGFAMLPPSRHLSGRDYDWNAFRAPWDCDLMDAPESLLAAIRELIGYYDRSELRPVLERTDNPATDLDAFGNRVDGREKYMSGIVWAAVLNLHRRQRGIAPDEDVEKAAHDDALMVYLRNVRTRLPGYGNLEGLEREGRGPTAFYAKWRHEMGKWEGKVATEAAKPSPRPFEGDGDSSPAASAQKDAVATKPGGIRTFDFATLFLENVLEEPDYIEDNLLGPGGFLLIGGPPKAQKSWLLQDMLVSAATGRAFLGNTFRVPRKLRVFWLQAEMNEKLLRRRAKAMTGLTPDEINDLAANLIVSDRFRMILDPNGVEVASKLIREQFAGEMPDIIAFDPMANLFDQENENDNAQVMKFLTLRIEAVRQLVNPMAGVILVHHATKKGPDEIRKDPFNCFRGGGALRGHYDSGIIIFRKADDGEEREVHFELRSGDEPEPLTVTLSNGRMLKSASKFFPEDNQKGWPDRETCKLILAAIETAWRNGKPWSMVPQTKQSGRYAPDLIVNTWTGIKPKVANELVQKWMMNGVVSMEIRDSHSEIRGLKVLGGGL